VFFVKFVREYLLFLPAVGAFAHKCLEILKILKSRTMPWRCHNCLLLKFECLSFSTPKPFLPEDPCLSCMPGIPPRTRACAPLCYNHFDSEPHPRGHQPILWERLPPFRTICNGGDSAFLYHHRSAFVEIPDQSFLSNPGHRESPSSDKRSPGLFEEASCEPTHTPRPLWDVCLPFGSHPK
jgi:hypothetical protein